MNWLSIFGCVIVVLWACALWGLVRRHKALIRVVSIGVLPDGNPCVVLEFPDCKGLPTYRAEGSHPRAAWCAIKGDELTIDGDQATQTRTAIRQTYGASSGTVA